jgi:hypothetical protein
MFILKPTGTGARERDYGLALCNQVFPFTFPLPCHTRSPETALVDAPGLVF